MTFGTKLVLALVALAVIAAGAAAWSAHERTVGAREATIAVQDSVSKAQSAIAAAATRAEAAQARRADSLAAIVRADSVAVARIAAKPPTVVRVPVATTPGEPPVLTGMVPESEYDAVLLRAARAAEDASRALGAKDSALRADSAALAAMQRQHRADSAIIVAVSPNKTSTGFWSHWRKFAGAGGAYGLDDHKLHGVAVVGYGYTW